MQCTYLHTIGYELEKNHEKILQRIACVLVEIRTTQLPNTIQRLNFIIIIIVIIIIIIIIFCFFFYFFFFFYYFFFFFFFFFY
jgi:ABC-type multidrug transport system permease subunit